MKVTTKVMTANRLGDGAVVYLADDNDWVLALDDAEVADGEEAAGLHSRATKKAAAALEARAAASAARQEVVSTYLFAVSVSDTGIAPVSQREIIRAAGPTVGTDLPATTPLV